MRWKDVVSNVKKVLSKGRRLEPGPAGNVVMATCVGEDGKPNIITLAIKRFLT